MPSFRHVFCRGDNTISLILNPGFTDRDWADVRDFVVKNPSVTNWDLDLRDLVTINSQMLGLIIGLKIDLSQTGGNLRMILKKESRLRHLISLSRLDRLIAVWEI